jgi:hypothetical protein
VNELIQLLQESLREAVEVQLLPVWEGDQAKAPKGEIVVNVAQLEPQKFFFNEQFVYRVRRGAAV